MARKTFGAGIWADNDSVSHYAYLRHLVEEFYPATGSFWGFSPRYNNGIPFLLYNTPPGLYVGAFLLTRLGFSAIVALKIYVVGSFLSIAPLGYLLARTFDAERTDAPKYVAISLALFTSELFGLEFFFRNGMLNPACALPAFVCCLIAFQHALQKPGSRSLRYVALGAFAFAWTAFTHLLSAYMLTVALLAFVVAPGAREIGVRTLKMGATLALGGALIAVWLVPSAGFAAKEDAAYTWLRNPKDTISSFLDGSLLSSYFAGFFPSFVSISNVSVFAVITGFVGAYEAIRRRNRGALGILILSVVALVIALGPTFGPLVNYLPGYERLLWYRFVTPFSFAWLVLAGWGAHVIAQKRQLYPYQYVLLVVGMLFSANVLFARAAKVETEESFPRFQHSYTTVSKWLREHGDKRGRIYSEFLGFGVNQPPSVNYVRHLLPVDTGLSEVSGWIYENNLASQRMMKRGVFWYDPAPIADDAERFALKYIVAGSPQFVRRLEGDARWQAVVRTDDLVLFEARNFEPAIATIDGVKADIASEGYLRGGGYSYRLHLSDGAQGKLTVRTNYSDAWSARRGGVAIPLRADADGFIEADLAGRGDTVDLSFSVGPKQHLGATLSFSALVIAAIFIGLSFRSFTVPSLALGAAEFAGVLVLVATSILSIVRSKGVDLSSCGFGVRDGIEASQDPHLVRTSTVDAIYGALSVRIDASTWTPSRCEGRICGRTPRPAKLPSSSHGTLRLGPEASLRISGLPKGAPIHIHLRGATEECADIEGSIGEAIQVQAACLALGDSAKGPGNEFRFSLTTAPDVLIETVNVLDGIRFMEAESFRNVVNDGGYDAFYSSGAPEYSPSNGTVMIADAPYKKPISLERTLRDGAGTFNVWILLRTTHPRFAQTRGLVSVRMNERGIGDVDGADMFAPEAFWASTPTFDWRRVGQTTLEGGGRMSITIAKKSEALAGFAELDVIALVPTPDKARAQ